MEWELPAHGWAPQHHVHPRLTEEYEVLEGPLEVLVGSEWRTLTAGDADSAPPQTEQTFRVGGGPVRVRNVHRAMRPQSGVGTGIADFVRLVRRVPTG